MINFSAGPSQIPVSVQQRLLGDMATQLPFYSCSHRSDLFVDVFDQIRSMLRDLLRIPDRFSILIMQAGASAQFSAVPMQLLSGKNDIIDVLDSGFWSRYAAREMSRYGMIHTIASSKDLNDGDLPPQSQWSYSTKAKLRYYTSNETFSGLSLDALPYREDGVPVVADMSSDFLSTPIEFDQRHLIFASSAKCFGVSGATIVLIDQALLEQSRQDLPMVLSYRAYHQARGQILNTPCTFAIYVIYLMLQWYQEQGGVSAIAKHNARKAAMLYEAIDQSRLFSNQIAKQYRSHVTVTSGMSSEMDIQDFYHAAKESNFIGIQGDYSITPIAPIRVSLYNVATIDQVEQWVNFMRTYEQNQANHV